REGEVKAIPDTQVLGPQANGPNGSVRVGPRMPVMHPRADPARLNGESRIELAQVALSGIEEGGRDGDLLPAPAEGLTEDAPGAAGMHGPVHRQAGGEGAVDGQEVRVRPI